MNVICLWVLSVTPLVCASPPQYTHTLSGNCQVTGKA